MCSVYQRTFATEAHIQQVKQHCTAVCNSCNLKYRSNISCESNCERCDDITRDRTCKHLPDHKQPSSPCCLESNHTEDQAGTGMGDLYVVGLGRGVRASRNGQGSHTRGAADRWVT